MGILIDQMNLVREANIPNYDVEAFRELTEDGSVKKIGQDKEGRSLILITPAKMFLNKVSPQDAMLFFYHTL